MKRRFSNQLANSNERCLNCQGAIIPEESIYIAFSGNIFKRKRVYFCSKGCASAAGYSDGTK